MDKAAAEAVAAEAMDATEEKGRVANRAAEQRQHAADALKEVAEAADLSSVPGQLSYFILKAKKRAVIDDSTARAAWALQNHKSDRAGNIMAPSNPQQPHHRLQAARGRGGVVLLFAVDEWVGYALMGPDSWLDESKPFPNHFSLDWKLQLPRTHGVPVSRRHWLAAQC